MVHVASSASVGSRVSRLYKNSKAVEMFLRVKMQLTPCNFCPVNLEDNKLQLLQTRNLSGMVVEAIP